MSANSTPPAVLSDRQQDILKAIVTEYVRSATPVGSSDLATLYDVGVSPATIRNDMGVLEAAGYLRQPHTSAGRIPTELGYQTYVEGMLAGGPVFKRQRSMLERRMARIRRHYELVVRETAELLAELTEQGAIAQTGSRTERSGLSNLVKLPELKDDDIASAVAEAFDRPHEIVQHLMLSRQDARVVPVPGGAPVEVFIGAQTGLGRVPLAVLCSTIELEPGREGHLLIIGPSRMHYSRNVAMLSYVSRLLSRYVRSQKKYLALVALVLPAGLFIYQLPHAAL